MHRRQCQPHPELKPAKTRRPRRSRRGPPGVRGRGFDPDCDGLLADSAGLAGLWVGLSLLVTAMISRDATTHIQSGNVVFTSTQTDTTAIAAALEHAIAESLSVRPTVVVLSRDTLSRVVADNPYPDETNPKFLHAAFTSAQLGSDALAVVPPPSSRPPTRAAATRQP